MYDVCHVFHCGRTARGELICLELGISRPLVGLGSPFPLCNHQDGAGRVGWAAVSELITATDMICSSADPWPPAQNGWWPRPDVPLLPFGLGFESDRSLFES